MPGSEETHVHPVVRADPSMAAALTAIAHAAKRHWGYPESQIQEWSPQLTVSAEEIQSRPTGVVMDADGPVGWYQLQPLGRSLRLDHLWVLPGAMGRGIGRALFDHACREGVRLGWPELRIVSDPNAEGFYLRMGARRIGVEFPDPNCTKRGLPVLLVHLGSIR
jgi:GNAT superfamily N-acetyltransferase